MLLSDLLSVPRNGSGATRWEEIGIIDQTTRTRTQLGNFILAHK